MSLWIMSDKHYPTNETADLSIFFRFVIFEGKAKQGATIFWKFYKSKAKKGAKFWDI